LFYPGLSTYDWLLSPAHAGAKMVEQGQACIMCHKGTAEDIGNPARPGAIIKETNAVPFDPNAGWKEGDILPGRLISRTDAKGSAADNDASYGAWKDGTYTLVWRRKLDTGYPGDDKIMKVGGKYTIGFAIHDDNVTTRFHHVSFPLTLGIGVDADIKAVTLK
jgi:hypothetical protein